jgi:hypothetical protein
LLITLALVITLIVLLFARDVSRSAHGAITARRSEDRSFGALANALITNENLFDGRLHRLLAEGTGLRRDVFAARLYQLAEELPSWSTAADALHRPILSHHVNETLVDLTTDRVAAYDSLLGDVARSLSLPWSMATTTAVANPAASLESTAKSWNVDRFALAKEPGTVQLDATSVLSAQYFAANGVTTIAHAPSLALVRAVSIAAVRVYPAPLPSRSGVLLLPPVTSVQLGVSVLNASYDEQPVTLTIRVTPLNSRGTVFRQTMSTTLGPQEAYAFVPDVVKTAPSEQARVVIIVTGARAAVGKVTTETYRLEMSPS